MHTIIIEVLGGLVQDVSGIPEGVEVEIRDYDDAAGDENMPADFIGTDESGDKFFKAVWEHDSA